jgi:hypothetical protein
MQKINIYIDGNNLYRAGKGLGFEIDYQKFGIWLRQKFNTNKIYLFVGFISAKIKFYEHIKRCGFILIF